MGKAYYGSRISANMTKTPEGFLICHNVPIARTGWQEYLGSEVRQDVDKVRVYRSEDEVFSPATIASFEGKPFVHEHPSQWVNPENSQKYSKGHAQNVRRGTGNESDLLLADIFVEDGELIRLIESDSKREISCGYECEYTELVDNCTEQKQIIGNHIALVTKGRAGDRVAIKDNETTEGGKKRMGKKVTKNFLAALGFKAYVKDADPEDVAEAMEAMKSEDEGGELENVASMENQEDDKLDRVLDMLENVMDRLEALEASDQKVHSEMDALDALEEELSGKETEDEFEGEESKTISPEEMEDEFAPELEPGVKVAEEEKPKNPIPNADSAINTIKMMKPIIAAIKDPVERRQAADSLAQMIKAQAKDSAPRKTGAFADMQKGMKTVVKDSTPEDDRALGRDIAKKHNPHYKEK